MTSLKPSKCTVHKEIIKMVNLSYSTNLARKFFYYSAVWWRVKALPALIMIIYQYEYNFHMIYDVARVWFLPRSSKSKENILYVMKMIYALIKIKMLSWGFFRDKTEVVSYREQYSVFGWMRVIYKDASMIDSCQYFWSLHVEVGHVT